MSSSMMMTSSSSAPITTTTTTTTTSSSTSTGPYLRLPSPTACDFGDPAGYDEDDSFCDIDVPFPVQIYGQSERRVYASTNGFLSIITGSSQYQVQSLPSIHIPENVVVPFWDDLALLARASPQQGIFYAFGSTNVTFEYYLGRNGTDQIYHFLVDYDNNSPGVFVFTYVSTGGMSDAGVYAGVGTQGGEDTRW